MGFLEAALSKAFGRSHDGIPVYEKSPKLLATPSHSSVSKFSLASTDASSTTPSSSSSSLSSSSTFWMSPAASRWSPRRYLPIKARNAVSKRQIAVIVCLFLGLIVWSVPPPRLWRQRVIHINIPQPISNPYQVLRPIAHIPKKNPVDPSQWLESNSNNRHAVKSDSRLLNLVSSLGHVNTRPRAALISLVRNSELEGIVQSMQQLEYHWNRKYRYPWIFFNDEEFSDEFKVSV
ncbi:MAG: hypothetical protein Q9167_004932 [Letrouitia subvulpina]